jgi:hypothetical protein
MGSTMFVSGGFANITRNFAAALDLTSIALSNEKDRLVLFVIGKVPLGSC